MSNWFLKILLVISTIGLIVMGCSEDDDNPVNGETVDDNTFALQVGNWWHYDEFIDGESWGFSWNQVDTMTIDGIQLFIFGSSLLPRYVHKGEQGLYTYNPELKESELWWKYPASTGDTYSKTRDDPYYYEVTYEVTSTDTLITVPAGTFNGCYEYTVTTYNSEYRPNYIYYKYYFKPTIGLIYRSENRSDNLYEHKLKRYDISGQGISAVARTFADEHWSEEVYRGYEYWLSQVYLMPGQQYNGTTEEWLGVSWEEKLDYLPTWFTHELPLDKIEEYYIVIGLYKMQFGIGWEGAHDEWDESNPDPFYQDYFSNERHVDFSNEYLDQYLDLW
ncbi:MAG: hypothetical protein P9L92_16090 [Candidatus Electryonea clarkiae]|nr:hypothetical protein [Candidatus Electryonea clarkiae]MDP8285271.1 hypothetical protein [Candidatus Electryonea clarkiae]